MESHKQPSQSIIFLQPFIDDLLRRETDAARIAHKLGTEPEKLNDPAMFLPANVVYSFLGWANSLVDESGYCARMGTFMAQGGWAAILPMFAEKTSVLRCFLQFCATAEDQGGSAIYRLEVQGRVALWKLFRPTSASSDARFADAVAIGFFVELLKQATHEAFQVADIVAITSDQSLIPEDLLPATSVIFGAEGVTLRFPAQWLEENIEKMVPAEGVASMHLPAYQPDDTPIRVQELVRKHISNPEFKLPEIAILMGMKSWRLQQDLKRADTSLSSIRNEVCRELAIQRVKAGFLPIAEIATSLGYSSASNFSRAFKEWTGTTPRNYRTR